MGVVYVYITNSLMDRYPVQLKESSTQPVTMNHNGSYKDENGAIHV